MKKLNKKGFTIVELVIVIAVIAILAGVLIPTFATVVEKANKSAALSNAKNAYEEWLVDNADKERSDMCIKVTQNSKTYYVHYKNGEFGEASTEDDNSCNATKYTVTSGKLTADATDQSTQD